VGLDIVELVAPGVARLVVLLDVSHPGVGETVAWEVAEVVIIVTGVGVLTNRSSGGNVRVGWDVQLEEDRAGVARISVEDEVLEHVLGSHGVEGGLHHGVGKHLMREGKSVHSTVIAEVHEYVVVGGGLDGLGAARNRAASHQSDEVVSSHRFTSEIMRNASVHILAVDVIDDLARIRILGAVCDIVIHHNNDTLIRNAQTLMENVVGMANISLHTIVVPASCSSSKQNPSVTLQLCSADIGKCLCAGN